MSQPADAQRDFMFTFRADGDGEAAPGVFTYMTVLRVYGQAGRALMVLTRHNGDLLGRPVGLFSEALTAERTKEVATAVEGVKWAELPKPIGGDISGSMLSIDYTHGPRIIQRKFNSWNTEFVRAIAPVMGQVDQLGSALLAKPQRAVDVTVTRTPAGFKLVIRNVGVGAVMIADPRQPAGAPAAAGATRGTVTLAAEPEQKPGWTAMPPAWRPVPLEPLGNASPTVMILPGKTHEVDTVPWTPPGPGKYMAQGIWKDYAGPEVDPNPVFTQQFKLHVGNGSTNGCRAVGKNLHLD